MNDRENCESIVYSGKNNKVSCNRETSGILIVYSIHLKTFISWELSEQNKWHKKLNELYLRINRNFNTGHILIPLFIVSCINYKLNILMSNKYMIQLHAHPNSV